MIKVLIGYIPLLIAILVMLLRLKRGKKFAFWIACFVYFILAMAIAIYFGAANFSSHDPDPVAGKISESIVSALLLSVLEVPILAVVFWVYKWRDARSAKAKTSGHLNDQ